MKVEGSLLGFEFEVRFGPALGTMIWYRKLESKMKHVKCRIFHDTAWATNPDYPTHRWYCCKKCQYTWLSPKHPGDGESSSP